jgi:hypothetical protein
MAVTVGLLGELGYVGIDAVLVPTPARRFGGGVREPVEIPRKLAEGVRGSGTSCSSESICSSTTWGHRGS